MYSGFPFFRTIAGDIEDGPNANTLKEALSSMGYETQLKKYFSGINTIYIGDNLEGGSDHRREGIAIGGQ